MALLIALVVPSLPQRQVVVQDTAQLRSALRNAQPGDTILVAPGEYEGGLFVTNLHGQPDKPIIISAQDPQKPPVIRGGTNGIQLSRASHVELRHLVVEGARYNGINIDDGGQPESPTRHIVLSHLVVRNIGPTGNCDGIKLSGVYNFRIETFPRCRRGESLAPSPCV